MLTTTQVADKYKVNIRTVQRWVTLQDVPHEKVPGRGIAGHEYLFHEEELDDYLRRHWWLLPAPTELHQLQSFTDRLIDELASYKRHCATLEASNRMLATANKQLAGAKR